MAWLVIIGYLIIWLPEAHGMLRKRQTGEMVAFAILWAAGLALALLISYDVPINQVTEALRHVFEPLGRALMVPPPM